MRIRALASDKCVKLPADTTRGFSVSADAGGDAEQLLARERAKLARQLHDEVASAMFAARLELDVASHLAEKGAAMETLRSALDDATRSANEAMAAIRGICAGLKESGREDTDILGALTELLRAFERRSGVQCLLSIRGECSAFQKEGATRILRIVRGKLDEIAFPTLVRRVQVDILVSQRHYGLKIRLHSMGEPSVRRIAEDGFLPESGSKNSRHRDAAVATAPGGVHKSIFAAKIPRGSGPEGDCRPSRQPRATVQDR